MWNPPGGNDEQLKKAVEVLLEDVKAATPNPTVVPAADLRKPK